MKSFAPVVVLDLCAAPGGKATRLAGTGATVVAADLRPARVGLIAANIAVRGAPLVTPVLINCQPPTLGKGDKWWRVPPRRVQFRLEVRDDIDTHSFTSGGTSEVMAARRLTEHLQQFFTRETQHHA